MRRRPAEHGPGWPGWPRIGVASGGDAGLSNADPKASAGRAGHALPPSGSVNLPNVDPKASVGRAGRGAETVPPGQRLNVGTVWHRRVCVFLSISALLSIAAEVRVALNSVVGPLCQAMEMVGFALHPRKQGQKNKQAITSEEELSLLQEQGR